MRQVNKSLIMETKQAMEVKQNVFWKWLQFASLPHGGSVGFN